MLKKIVQKKNLVDHCKVNVNLTIGQTSREILCVLCICILCVYIYIVKSQFSLLVLAVAIFKRISSHLKTKVMYKKFSSRHFLVTRRSIVGFFLAAAE